MNPINIDIVILSFAKDDSLKALTEEAVKTVLESENSNLIKFNVYVIESNKDLKPYQYLNSTTIYPRQKFGYNRYMNIGITAGKSQYICLCNNDLIFHKNWASEILNSFEDRELLSANSFCELYAYRETVNNGPLVMSNLDYPNTHGILTGWCIMVKRDLFKIIGPLDERFRFWYADNDYQLTLDKFKIKHALIKTSKVSHLGNMSHHTLEEKLDNYTIKQKKVFEIKWKYGSTLNYYYSRIIYRLKTLK